MTTRKQSAKSSAGSKRPSARRSAFGNEIVQGLRELRSHMQGKIALRTRIIHVSDAQYVRSVRQKSGLSQSEFAARYGFNPRTLQDWEQGRTRPDSAIRAYLTVIDRNPAAVDKALAS